MSKFRIKVGQDDGEFNDPREWDNLGKMVCFNRNYSLGDNTTIRHEEFDSWDEMEAYLIKEYKAEVILPLYLYDHSMITMNTTGFSCRWDSGQVGFIYATREDILNGYGGKKITKTLREKAEKVLLSEVEVYDQYIRGDVYFFNIEKCEPIVKIPKDEFDAGNYDNAEEECEWEYYDSCHGLFGTTIDNGIMEYSGAPKEIVEEALGNIDEWIEYEVESV
jgi:hypothetical protein